MSTSSSIAQAYWPPVQAHRSTPRGVWGEAHRQPLDAVDEVPGQVLRFADPQVREPEQQFLEQRLELHAGQVATQAEVRAAAAEADVVVRFAGDVEALWGVEHRLVLIAGAVEHHDLLPGGDGLAVDLGVDARGAPERHHRAGPTDELLHRGADPPVVV